MKTLTECKKQYKRAVTKSGKSFAMNSAMLNLSYEDQQKFITWQVKQMNK